MQDGRPDVGNCPSGHWYPLSSCGFNLSTPALRWRSSSSFFFSRRNYHETRFVVGIVCRNGDQSFCVRDCASTCAGDSRCRLARRPLLRWPSLLGTKGMGGAPAIRARRSRPRSLPAWTRKARQVLKGYSEHQAWWLLLMGRCKPGVVAESWLHRAGIVAELRLNTGVG